MADKTQTVEGREASRQAEALDKKARAHQEPLNYGTGEGAIDRVHGLGIRYAEPKPTPDVEPLEGVLDYDEDDYAKAVEIGKAIPAPSPDELRETLETLAKNDNQRELRKQLGVQIVRLSENEGEAIEALKQLRLKMTPLQANHPPSQKVMAEMIDELIDRTQEKTWADGD